MKIVWEDYLGRDDLKNASNEDIQALEKVIGKQLPRALAELLKSHGGETPLNLVPRYPNGRQMSIDCIYHAFPDDEQDGNETPPSVMSCLQDEGYINLVPFSDKGNVFLCLDYNDRDYDPPVVMVIRDFVPDDPKHKYKLADSFDEFLTKYTIPLDQAPT